MVSLKKFDISVLGAAYAGMFFFVPVATSPTVICGAVVLIVWIISGRLLSDIGPWLKSELALPVLALIALPWIGLLYTPLPEAGFPIALKTHYWLYAVAVVSLVPVRGAVDRMIKMYLAGLSLNSVISALQFAGIAPLKKGLATGLLGGSSAHIAYSLLLTTGMLIASFYFARAEGPKQRAVYGAALLLYFVTMGFTGGRSGYLALIVLSPLLVHNLVGRRHIFKIAVLSIATVSLLFTSPVVRSRFAKAAEDIQLYRQGIVNTSLGLRFHMWQISLNDIRENPILGLGTGGFERSWELHKGDNSLPSHNHPHNSFLYMTVSYGIIGLAAFCWVLFVMLKRGWKGRESAPGFAVLSFTAVFIIGSLSDTQLLPFATSVAFPLFAGLSEAAGG